jgi:rhodanese-like protein
VSASGPAIGSTIRRRSGSVTPPVPSPSSPGMMLFCSKTILAPVAQAAGRGMISERGWGPASLGKKTNQLETDTITREELNELIGSVRTGQMTLVDVLSPESYSTRHIPGAVNLPVADIPRRAPEVLPDRDAPIIVYCGSPT